MTIEQRLEQLELQNQRIERKNKRLTAALAVMAVAICAVVTMAATGEKDGDFDTVTARYIWVKNDAGSFVVTLGADDGGNGLVMTESAQDKDLVELGATADGTGGLLRVFNKTGEDVVHLGVDEYGNGLVGAYNRKGVGRTLQSGP